MSTIDNEAFAWVARERARGLDVMEMAQLDAWCAADTRHLGAYARAMAIHNAIHLGTSHEALPATPGDCGCAPPLSWRRQLVLGGLAASLVATAGKFAYSAMQAGTILITEKGEFRRVPLQDASIANINSGSQLEIAFTRQQRRINLSKGEAWFDVAKDASKPFIVEAGDARIRAVGTAFAVRRLAAGSEVLVTEGTVEVWSKEGTAQRRLVTAGEHAFLAHDAAAIAVTRQPDEVKRRLAWREGKLVLARQTLGEAVADFNRYSPRPIVIVDPALRDKRLVGQYQLDAPESFAKDVSTILEVPVVITAEKILIGRARASHPRTI
jgi:transmembrane sensor